MVDGTGMCGGCRVQLWNPAKGEYEARFSCVDGPAFDGYAVDFAHADAAQPAVPRRGEAGPGERPPAPRARPRPDSRGGAGESR